MCGFARLLVRSLACFHLCFSSFLSLFLVVFLPRSLRFPSSVLSVTPSLVRLFVLLFSHCLVLSFCRSLLLSCLRSASFLLSSVLRLFFRWCIPSGHSLDRSSGHSRSRSFVRSLLLSLRRSLVLVFVRSPVLLFSLLPFYRSLLLLFVRSSTGSLVACSRVLWFVLSLSRSLVLVFSLSLCCLSRVLSLSCSLVLVLVFLSSTVFLFLCFLLLIFYHSRVSSSRALVPMEFLFQKKDFSSKIFGRGLSSKKIG